MFDRKQQIIQAHAGVIVQVVQSIGNPQLMPQTEEILKVSEQNGWNQLVAVIRRIISGEREVRLLQGLDEEDATIAAAILEGLQNPATLPDPNQQADASMAAPGIAHMVHQASTGNAQALQIISQMAEQMTSAGGDMRLLGGIVRKMINGERDPNILARGMGTQGRQLVDSILEELARLAGH
jgi:NAD(P)H-flavin reductase